MSYITWPVIAGFLRHALTTLGGVLVANGHIGAEDAQTAIGALMTLSGLAWSIVEKRAR